MQIRPQRHEERSRQSDSGTCPGHLEQMELDREQQHGEHLRPRRERRRRRQVAGQHRPGDQPEAGGPSSAGRRHQPPGRNGAERAGDRPQREPAHPPDRVQEHLRAPVLVQPRPAGGGQASTSTRGTARCSTINSSALTWYARSIVLAVAASCITPMAPSATTTQSRGRLATSRRCSGSPLHARCGGRPARGIATAQPAASVAPLQGCPRSPRKPRNSSASYPSVELLSPHEPGQRPDSLGPAPLPHPDGPRYTPRHDGRVAQRESAAFTRQRPQVRNLSRPPAQTGS
jgi:hypothetical protein